MAALTAAGSSIQQLSDLGWGAVFIAGVVLTSGVLALYRRFNPLPPPFVGQSTEEVLPPAPSPPLHVPSPEHTWQIAKDEREMPDVLLRLEALERNMTAGQRDISDLQIRAVKATLILAINRAFRRLVVPPADEQMKSENAQSFEAWRKMAEDSLQAAQSELRGLERFRDIENCLANAEAAADRDLAEMPEEDFPKALNPFAYRHFSVARMKCRAFSVYLLRKTKNLEAEQIEALGFIRDGGPVAGE